VVAFAETLRRLRLKNSWSEYQLADLTGLKRNTIHSWERGRALPNGANLLRVSQPFNPLEQQELFEAAGYIPTRTNEHRTVPSSVGNIIREIEQYYESMGIVELPIRGTVPGPPFSIKEKAVKYYPISKVRLGDVETEFLYALIVSGELFEENNIYDGDVMVVDQNAELEAGKLYILELENKMVARCIYWEENKITLVSPDGERRIVKADELKVLGRVILAGRWTRF